MFATSYAYAMAVLGLITGLYLLAIGFGLHLPRFRQPIPQSTLVKLRLWSKVAGIASLLLAAFYLFAALR